MTGEDFLLGTQLRLSVGSGQTNVNIEITNSTFAAGATGVLTNQIGAETEASIESTVTSILDRREGYELELGVRGYAEQSARIQRNSAIRLTGAWQDGDKSRPERPFVSGSECYLGRNRPSSFADFSNEQQLCSLRFYDANGSLNRDRSMAVSGKQLRLTARNDRIYIDNIGRHEVRKNGKPILHEDLLNHEDVLELPGPKPIRIKCFVRAGATSEAEFVMHRLS